MKKIFIFLLFLIVTTIGYSQSAKPQGQPQMRLTKEQYEDKLDSVMAVRTIQKMQSLFSVNERQEQSIREAMVTLNRQRKAVFMEYRKTPELPEKMQQQDRWLDSVYTSIVGAANFEKFKAAIVKEREQKQAAMAARMQAKFGPVDTTRNKRPVTKPLN